MGCSGSKGLDDPQTGGSAQALSDASPGAANPSPTAQAPKSQAKQKDDPNRVVIPRGFRLLDELEKGQKAERAQHVSWGLLKDDDMSLSEWSATIFGPIDTAFDNRIFSLHIICGPAYPDEPPSVKFTTPIHMNCIEADGTVKPTWGLLNNWRRECTIESILDALRREMSSGANKIMLQPAGGPQPGPG